MSMEWLINDPPERFGANRRLVKVELTGELIKDLITEGNIITGSLKCIRGIPEDAVFICSSFHDSNQVACLIFYHKSFAPVEVGSDIPTVKIMHHKDEPTK